MHISAYLTTSRHNVFYFRWPLPKSTHPHQKTSDIKLSLYTRDLKEALQLSRLLAYIAHSLSIRMKNNNMRYDEMRELLRQHFTDVLAGVKGRIARNGRLKENNIEYFKEIMQNIDDDSYVDMMFLDGRHPVHDVIEKHDLLFKENTQKYQEFKEEYNNARKSFCREVLDYNASFDLYDFKAKYTDSHQSNNHALQSTTLEKLVESYIAERVRGGNWTPRTEKNYRSKLNLLFDILSKNELCLAIDIAVARKVKETLQGQVQNCL